MSNQEFLETLHKRIGVYYWILKESWMDTTLSNEKQKVKEKRQRYLDEVDRFLGLKN